MTSNAKDIYLNCSGRLSAVYEKREAESVCKVLLEDIWAVDWSGIILEKQVDISTETYEQYIRRLLDHEPVQHITGMAYFLGRKFRVDKNVLIPRPETEEMVHWILREIRKEDPVIWDIGTGSGCIAISLAAALPAAKIFGTDVSKVALDMARRNNDDQQTHVEFIESNILLKTPDLPHPDIIVSNPPYIPIDEHKMLAKNVSAFEPQIALFTPQNDPLLFYRTILESAKKILRRPHGKVYFEMHENYAHEVEELVKTLGMKATLAYDMQRKPRMICASAIT